MNNQIIKYKLQEWRTLKLDDKIDKTKLLAKFNICITLNMANTLYNYTVQQSSILVYINLSLHKSQRKYKEWSILVYIKLK